MVALTILARTRLRRGDPGWREALEEAWERARETGEPQRVAPVAAGWGEAAWLHGEVEPARSIVAEAYSMTLPCRDSWALGEVAYWGWKAGLFAARTEAAAEPFAQQLEGQWQLAAASWERLGCPYEAALALTEGDAVARREGLLRLERMGAEPVVAAVQRQAPASHRRRGPGSSRATSAGARG
jgi:hypothetical protein